MNNYNDYYNFIDNYNNNLNNYMNKLNTQNYSKIDPYQGFLRGNLFDNLYVPYMNYKPRELNPDNEKEYYMLMVQTYAFAAHDLTLYLDVNPNDSNAIKLRNKYLEMYNEAKTQYENKYGPITLNSNLLDTNTWIWDSKKWPWEGNK